PSPGGPAPAPRASIDEAGLSGRAAAKRPALLWGLLAGLIWLGAWWVSKRWRKWPAYLLAAPFFFVVLFVFFENFARLLPSNF
ncbi:MAG TPA: hypothetical protein VGO92_08910, partial [Acidimicrobiales bacterium]|nr:hypothetical protein [Acidimicrobiales bacterium]